MAVKRRLFDKRKIKIFQIYGATKENAQNAWDRLIMWVINKKVLRRIFLRRRNLLKTVEERKNEWFGRALRSGGPCLD